jgi:phosphatidylglycerophosphate synthase
VNWFGDSLDGTVARYRKIERPRYGYFLDNCVDLVEQLLLAVGIGLSGMIRWDLSFLALAAFLMLSVLSLVRQSVSGVFHLAYGGIGPTEMRAMFVALNALVYFYPPDRLDGLGLPMTYPNILSLMWSIGALLTFAVSFIAQVRKLAAEDPPRQPGV